MSMHRTSPSPMLGVDQVWYFREYRESSSGSLLRPRDCIEHYRRNASAKALSPNLAFDEFWYRRLYRDVTTQIKAGEVASGWEHYLKMGYLEGRNPVWWFDEAWYQAKYPDIKEAVRAGRLACGFEHYLLYGMRQDFSPSLYFDTQWYRQCYLSGDKDGESWPIADYLLNKHRSARCPVRFFDSSWYKGTYLWDEPNNDVTYRWRTPYEHYIFVGRLDGYSPSAQFDERAYRELNPEASRQVAAGRYVSGFEHYVQEGALTGAVMASHLDTAGMSYAAPAFLQAYERSMLLLARQRDLLTRLWGNSLINTSGDPTENHSDLRS